MVCENCISKLRQLPSSRRKLKITDKPLQQNDKFKKTSADKFKKCKICKKVTHREGAYYCQDCSYQKGICALCGRKISNTTSYRQSAT
uniref:Cysteine-rich PDZ-binding protein n=1 Tax=Parastrongyloides trichosuri TaxID=131310 RepID=A0A0N4Z9F3_PARTI